ncbi:ribosome-associated protein [Pseudomonas guineae]|uniref:Ribosomal silencing factor RsfS n=3 Tax=Pseudomonas guineae TaxID=425504 RepID=A0A1I3LNA8_9PSED|nr:ribosome-associated protein [Pseudomonas guineae]|tara:strand:+ start:7563 stop:7955 length:393 start_codon:yes stop_codon:yes gene_type:complete
MTNAKKIMPSEDLVKLAIAALEEIKAQDITTIDVRGKTSITDFMLIASGTSSRHVKSLIDNVLEKVKEQGVRPIGTEGMDTGEWALLDLGDIVVHVMLPTARQFYDLERLWQGAEQSRAQFSAEPSPEQE